MRPTVGDWQRLSDWNATAALARVETHLESGEEVLVTLPVRPIGRKASTLWFARIRVTADGTQYTLWTNGRMVKQIAEALQPGPATA